MKIKPLPEASSTSVHGITSLFSAGVNFSAFFCLCLASRTASDPLRFSPRDKLVTRVIIVNPITVAIPDRFKILSSSIFFQLS